MLSRDRALKSAAEIMTAFAERTGLSSDRPPQRYLWTDAFAVCNFIGLARETGQARHLESALRLVDQVHQTLGRYRPDDLRTGWISGLTESEGRAHPTRGGLRIGKRFPERRSDQPFDDDLEWERDGQYFHYLTKWMHALDQLARATQEPRFNLWARELASAAHAAFAFGPASRGSRRMAWKMSTDLSRALVPSMGQHDPLDGFLTCFELQTTAGLLAAPPGGPNLKEATADLAAMIDDRRLATADPLGLGGLLMDAFRVEQLMSLGDLAGGDLLEALLTAALEGLSQYARQDELRQRASRRLAFRELGLAIGLHAVEIMEKEALTGVRRRRAEPRLKALTPHLVMGSAIETFWLDPTNRASATWSAHREINEVMLATCLVPEGCLVLEPGR